VLRRPELPRLDELVELVADHGVERLGVAPVDVLARARQALADRRAAGLAADMQFTYRNPERSTDPAWSLPDARSMLVAARSYYTVDQPARPPGPQARVARYAWTDHYEALRTALRAVAERLEVAGERAMVFCDDNGLVDREAAYRAGLGWFGKNANLLLPGAGSWFVLGAVITTACYEPAAQLARDGCGSCQLCVSQCPTGAIVGPGVIDANRCLAWVLQRPGPIPERLRVAVGDRIYGCDDCQDVCPPNIRLAGRHEWRASDGGRPVALDAWVDVLDLLAADDEQLLARYGRWYIAGRDPRWLRRNALVVLGNSGDPHDPRVAAMLATYRSSDDPILAEHARWASVRLGLTAAVPA
jgi:epoxyqueuosine reductase